MALAQEPASLVLEGSAKVKVSFPFEKASLHVACHYALDAEGEGSPVVFFHPDDYAVAARIQESGLQSVRLQPGEVCDHPERGGTLTYAITDLYARASEVHAEVLKSGGYKTLPVAFVNMSSLNESIEKAKSLALQQAQVSASPVARLGAGLGNVEFDFDFRTITANVACLVEANSEGEGYPGLYFSPADYRFVESMRLGGLYSTSLPAGELCDHPERGGTLPFVMTGLYTKAAAIDALVRENGGYEKLPLVLWSSTQSSGNEASAKAAALKAIFAL
jgi:hypothetical protein